MANTQHPLRYMKTSCDRDKTAIQLKGYMKLEKLTYIFAIHQ